MASGSMLDMRIWSTLRAATPPGLFVHDTARIGRAQQGGELLLLFLFHRARIIIVGPLFQSLSVAVDQPRSSPSAYGWSTQGRLACTSPIMSVTSLSVSCRPAVRHAMATRSDSPRCHSVSVSSALRVTNKRLSDEKPTSHTGPCARAMSPALAAAPRDPTRGPCDPRR